MQVHTKGDVYKYSITDTRTTKSKLAMHDREEAFELADKLAREGTKKWITTWLFKGENAERVSMHQVLPEVAKGLEPGIGAATRLQTEMYVPDSYKYPHGSKLRYSVTPTRTDDFGLATWRGAPAKEEVRRRVKQGEPQWLTVWDVSNPAKPVRCYAELDGIPKYFTQKEREKKRRANKTWENAEKFRARRRAMHPDERPLISHYMGLAGERVEVSFVGRLLVPRKIINELAEACGWEIKTASSILTSAVVIGSKGDLGAVTETGRYKQAKQKVAEGDAIEIVSEGYFLETARKRIGDREFNLIAGDCKAVNEALAAMNDPKMTKLTMKGALGNKSLYANFNPAAMQAAVERSMSDQPAGSFVASPATGSSGCLVSLLVSLAVIVLTIMAVL